MGRREFEELSAGHALHALDRTDESVYSAELITHPEWDEVARRDEDTVAALADALGDVAPPAGLRAALLDRIRDDTVVSDALGADDALPALLDAASTPVGPVPTEVVQTVARRTWTRGILALAASFALLAVLGFGSAWLGGRLFPQAAETVALEQIERSADGHSASVPVQGGGEATAYWSESLGQAVLVTQGVAQLESRQTYEMWLVRDGSAVAAGTFDVGEDGRITTVLAGVMERGDSIAVTVEPAGGSLDGTPSTDPVVLIPTGAV